jgi:hypothetical protein
MKLEQSLMSRMVFFCPLLSKEAAAAGTSSQVTITSSRMASIDARYHQVTFLRFWLAEIAALSEVHSFRPFFHSAVL